MSFSTSAHSVPCRFGVVLTSFLQQPGLPFADVLSEGRIQAAFDEEGVAFAQEEDEIYKPPLTLWAFLSQVLFHGEHRTLFCFDNTIYIVRPPLISAPQSQLTCLSWSPPGDQD